MQEGFEYIPLANKVEFYEFRNSIITLIETVDIEEFIDSGENDILLASQIFLKNKNDTESFRNYAVKYTSTNPEFTLLKVVKSGSIDDSTEVGKVCRIRFLKDEDPIYTQDFFEVTSEGVIQYLELMNYWSVVRYDFSGGLDHSSEYYIHKKYNESHYKDSKPLMLETELVNESVIDLFYASDKSENVNGNLITKYFQMFYQGNLINDSKVLRSIPDKGLSSYVINLNDDAKFNKILRRDYNLIDAQIEVKK